MDNKYELTFGIHRGTITSRDSAMVRFDTRDEAVKSYLSASP